MMEQMVSKEKLFPLILNAPVRIGVKERCLQALAVTDDLLRDLVDFCKYWQDLNGADIETCEARHLYGWTGKREEGKIEDTDIEKR